MANLKSKINKIYNILLVLFFIISALTIVGYIWYDSYKVKKHLEECRELCKPDEVVDALSFDHCVCKKVIDTDDMI